MLDDFWPAVAELLSLGHSGRAKQVTRLFRIDLSYTSEKSALFDMSQGSILTSLSLSYSELKFIVQIANRMMVEILE